MFDSRLIPLMTVGNKTDLPLNRQVVSEIEGKKIFEAHQHSKNGGTFAQGFKLSLIEKLKK